MKHKILYLRPQNLRVNKECYHTLRNIIYFDNLDIILPDKECVVSVEPNEYPIDALYSILLDWMRDDYYHIVYLSDLFTVKL